jgi:hypothetical protein
MRKILLAALISTLSMSVYAEGHYVPGIEGVKAASVPPAGNYYVGYYVNYDADLKVAGNKIGKAKVNALAHRFVHMSHKKVLGADYGAELIVPMLNKDITVTGAYDKSKFGVGDVYVGPLVLGWHGDRWDAAAAAGVWLDTASDSELASAGNGYRSTMLTAGGTRYLNADKSVSASVLGRYESNSRRKATGIKAGDQVSVEWGIGKKYPSTWETGVVGYDQWQVSSDDGVGASSQKAHRHAIGLEASHPVKSLKGLVKAAYYHEYDTKSGNGPVTDGDVLRVNFVKPF